MHNWKEYNAQEHNWFSRWTSLPYITPSHTLVANNARPWSQQSYGPALIWQPLISCNLLPKVRELCKLIKKILLSLKCWIITCSSHLINCPIQKCQLLFRFVQNHLCPKGSYPFKKKRVCWALKKIMVYKWNPSLWRRKIHKKSENKHYKTNISIASASEGTIDIRGWLQSQDQMQKLE